MPILHSKDKPAILFHRMTDEKNFIKTSDFALASTLNCLGYDIAGIDKSNRKRVVFYFERTSQVEITIKQYFANQVRLNPLDYDSTQKQIHAQIHTDL